MVLLVALAFVVAIGIAELVRRPRWAPAAAAAAVLATLATLAVQELRQQGAWKASWQAAQQVESAILAALPDRPPHGAGVATFDHVTQLLPADVPVFSSSWDLNGAVRLLYRDPSLRARPWDPSVRCAPDGVLLGVAEAPGLAAPPSPVPYGRMWFVDVGHHRGQVVGSFAECRRLVAALTR
jgi:hypothetical protein